MSERGLQFRLLIPEESRAAAGIHQRAGALIPGYDPSQQPLDEFSNFYRDEVMTAGPVWGAFLTKDLVGHVALLPGWIDHLFVDPTWHGRGIGSALVRLAQREQAELRLYTFQANLKARALYERHGFVVEELTDGQRNDEKMPDVTYYWRKLYRD
jgi:putative acetyltransferase